MKQKFILSYLFFISSFCCQAQQPVTYSDSINEFFHHYIENHDVIKNADTTYFRFFVPDETFRVAATVIKTDKARWFKMESSGLVKKMFREYAVASFNLHDTLLTLTIYQSQDLMTDPKYQGYLFVPFTDLTTGNETYHTGRYLDFDIKDIKNEQLIIDFNKAYNPSCAYVTGKYNCPVPPAENSLEIAVRAGERNFDKGPKP